MNRRTRTHFAMHDSSVTFKIVIIQIYMLNGLKDRSNDSISIGLKIMANKCENLVQTRYLLVFTNV